MNPAAPATRIRKKPPLVDSNRIARDRTVILRLHATVSHMAEASWAVRAVLIILIAASVTVFWLRFRKVVLPAAFPSIFASVRIAAGLAWVTIVVAELIDAKMPSLGYLLALAGAYPRVPQMLLALAAVGIMVFLFDLAALLCHARATRWMERAG